MFARTTSMRPDTLRERGTWAVALSNATSSKPFPTNRPSSSYIAAAASVRHLPLTICKKWAIRMSCRWTEVGTPGRNRVRLSKRSLNKMETPEFDHRARTREIQSEFASRGDVLGWFEALYKESEGNNELIPWADLEPNRFFVAWAEKGQLKGESRKALVVGCGLGDDARYLHD